MKEKYDNKNDISNYQTMAHNMMFTQMNAKRGIFFLVNMR